MLRAWVDESIHVEKRIYVFAAFLLQADDAPSVAEDVWKLRRGRAPRFHWRRETAVVRRRFVRALRGIDGSAVIVIGTGLNHTKQERARRQCLHVLVTRLADQDVSSVVMERRSRSLNEHDHSFLDVLRGKRWIDKSVVVEFGDPNIDSLLWVADALCGMVTSQIASGEGDVGALIPFPHVVVHVPLRM